MNELKIGVVGSKGELFPPKELREKIGLKVGQKVIYRDVNGRLVVEILPEAEEVLNRPSKVTVSFEEIKKDRQQLSHEAEADISQ